MEDRDGEKKKNKEYETERSSREEEAKLERTPEEEKYRTFRTFQSKSRGGIKLKGLK